jgi:hypothetical protein
MKDTRIPLSATHRRKLWFNVSWALTFPFLAIGMFYFTMRWVGGDDFMASLPWFFKVFAGLMGLAMVGIVVFITAQSFQDLKRGEARVIQGVVTEKKKEITTKTTSHYNGRGSSTSTSTSTSNFIFIDDVKFKVENAAYSSVRTGDLVELTLAPHSGIQLGFEILERNAVEIPQLSEEKLWNPSIQEEFLDEEDRALLKRWRVKRIKRRLWFSLVPGFIQFGLLASGLWGFTIFLFPLYIVLIWQLVGGIRSYLAYKHVLEQDRKTIEQVMLVDKSVTTNNGKPSFVLFAGSGQIFVNEESYRQASVNQPISLHRYGSIKTPLAVTVQGQISRLI